ncbi:nucleoside diphosphate-linked moiety X motif 6-like isoform X2 [Biomphalaria glabrata]|uniref:Nucleoside diphosphate-linked moiety X motif 6 n=1 Tax=Biomphalaria glabrata TaxID=6526 RepID=A0A9W3B7B3_BIOGL|nr:nucleoside diphosphate-linked moiety X motif 6-like isoform X2 [Biomphalaria glabrata]
MTRNLLNCNMSQTFGSVGCLKLSCRFILCTGTNINIGGKLAAKHYTIRSNSFLFDTVVCDNGYSTNKAIHVRHSLIQKRLFFYSTLCTKEAILSGETDRYNGVWVDMTKNSLSEDDLTKVLLGMAVRDDTKEVLVVKDKNRPFQLWKFPGGLSDLGEDIAATAEREVFEETGVKTEYQSVLAFRQQHKPPGAFGRSDLYVICRLKPLTYELNPCQEEIESCRWMSLEELKSEVQATSLTHIMAELVLYGLRHGFQQVDITSYQMASIYKGLKFHIFHRPFGS